MRYYPSGSDSRRKAIWGPRRLLLGAVVLFLAASVPVAADTGGSGQHSGKGSSHKGKTYRLDGELEKRAERRSGTTRVIIELNPGYDVAGELHRLGGVLGRRLGIINGQVAEVPNTLLRWLEKHPGVASVHYDRPAAVHNYRTSVTVGAAAAQAEFGLSGQGIGIAVIDSGITSWHNDLTGLGAYGNQRVAKFVDFVNGRLLPYDDNGHGTHIAGTIAGNGYNSGSAQKAGMAPKATLVVLKALNRDGQGTISNIIAALDWIVANRVTYNIRVANLSLGAAVHESYWTDPLTRAAKRAVDAGVVVVAAAGNLGKNAAGHTQYGGITAPGNAPWVLTVGASSTMGTITRIDDTVGAYSSRGPTPIDFGAKPDLVAPGTGTVSLSDPTSLFYVTKAQYLVNGAGLIGYKPYLSLSGTSMAAPVVSGSIALMLQANPLLTPNAVKAILQYTAQVYPNYDFLTQGAGFLNTAGAVRLASFLKTMQPGQSYPSKSVWAKHIIWGNHRLRGGYLLFNGANAWNSNVVWGNSRTDDGDNIVWGNLCGGGDCDNVVWGNAFGDDNVVWGNAIGDNVVWGNSADDDNVVWGNACDNADCDNVVWGNVLDDNVVWGNLAGDDNVVWGNSGEGLVYGTSGDDEISWGSAAEDETVFPDEIDPAEQNLTFEELFGPVTTTPPPTQPPSEGTTSSDPSAGGASSSQTGGL